MTNAAVPIRSTEEVARTIGDNMKSVLAEQGRNLEWLANEIGIDVQSILKQFGSKVESWLTLDAAFYLNVPVDRFIGAESKPLSERQRWVSAWVDGEAR